MNPAAKISDVPLALRSRHAAERERAWRDLYDQHFDSVYMLALRFGVVPADAEDVVQQVFCIAHRKLGREEVENVGGWLRAIAARTIRDHHRWRRVRKVKRGLVDALWRAREEEQPAADAGVELTRAQALVADVLAAMNPRFREVLVLTEIEELSQREVGSILGISVNTVRSRRVRARAMFKKLWRRRVCEEAVDG